MNILFKRLFLSALFVSLTVFVIFHPSDILFFLAVETFALIGLFEYLQLAKAKGFYVPLKSGMFFGALMPFAAYYPVAGLILSVAALWIFALYFRKPMPNSGFFGTAVTVFGLIYIPWFFAHLIMIRDMPVGPEWVFYTVLLVKGGDAGAYFLGTQFGKNKMMPEISPKKTWEGSLAGLLTTVILSLLSGFYLPQAGWPHLVALGLAVGILAQVADFAESLIKRDAGVKDSGVLPGLGGILDMLDSLLLTVPFVYYYLKYVL